jgi:hypothetical protein
MATGSSISLLMLAWLLVPVAFAKETDSERILVVLGSGQWMAPRDEFFVPGVDLDAGQEGGKLLTDRFDLNGDGAPEYFLQTVCGNGGCEYPLFDGRTYAYLGSVFGSTVWLLRRRSHGLPAIEAYSHLSAMRGTIGRYEFNGTQYREMSSQEIGDEETQALYKRLEAAPRIKTQ